MALQHFLKTTPARDRQGYLKSRSDWTPILADKIAAQEDILLTPNHWEVISFLQEFYTDFGKVPAIRALLKALSMKYGPEKGQSIYLQQLFPKGPLQQACKIAGLPKPPRCL